MVSIYPTSHGAALPERTRRQAEDRLGEGRCQICLVELDTIFSAVPRRSRFRGSETCVREKDRASPPISSASTSSATPCTSSSPSISRTSGTASTRLRSPIAEKREFCVYSQRAETVGARRWQTLRSRRWNDDRGGARRVVRPTGRRDLRAARPRGTAANRLCSGSSPASKIRPPGRCSSMARRLWSRHA